MDEHKDTQNDVKPADALGRLSERARASRFSGLIVALIALIVLAFLVGMIIRGVSGGFNNAPDIPRVNTSK